MNSEQMAGSVGSNASYIRKILALLKKAKIIDGNGGSRGYFLTASPKQITLLNIYQAVMMESEIHLLDIHQNSSDRCIVGRHIKPVLTGMFADIEESFAHSLDKKTLADCIDAMHRRIQ